MKGEGIQDKGGFTNSAMAEKVGSQCESVQRHHDAWGN